MALDIATFSNTEGGFPFFKAAGHPAVAPRAIALIDELAGAGRVAVYDPLGFATAFAALYPFDRIDVAHVFVQDLSRLGTSVLGRAVQPVTDLSALEIDALLVVAYDAGKLAGDIAHLVPDGTKMVTLDAIRLPNDRLTNPKRYLDPLNFATNFAWFRDEKWQAWTEDGDGADRGSLHTCVATANYWQRYGARNVRLWCILLGEDGTQVAEWDIALPDTPGGITIDSRDVRRQFGLGDFTGQLFIHAIGVAGHDIVKYALDLFGDDGATGRRALTCTHDANAWPADFYGGLPAPRDGERVVLWVQNSQPCPIPPGAIGLSLMGADADGDDAVAWLDAGVPAFGTFPLDVAELLPDASWPQQIEIRAGKYFVRPRYEIETPAEGGARRRMAHANVERTDLDPDPAIAEIGNLMGKGYLLPAPVLPSGRFRSIALPTPMARGQRRLPTQILVYDPDGTEVARHGLGNLARTDSVAVDIDRVLNGHGDNFAGHMELVYDFAAMGDAPEDGVDGWLHALFRYEMRDGGHAAETSFGAHIFNSVLTFKGEPQSYGGRAPGLTTRLFLRVGPDMAGDGAPDAFCQLIYPASTPWHTRSQTRLTLFDGAGTEIATRDIEIPCGGSRLWYLSETFDADERRTAAARGAAMAGDGRAGGYVMIRDTTCRLFGYHGLIAADGSAFSLDHMFGF